MEEKADELWASHAEWMKTCHTNKGDHQIMQYHVCKSRGVKDNTNPPGSTNPDDSKVQYTIVEFYKNKEGLQNHMDMFYGTHTLCPRSTHGHHCSMSEGRERLRAGRW